MLACMLSSAGRSGTKGDPMKLTLSDIKYVRYNAGLHLGAPLKLF